MNDFCLKQGQGLKASAAHLYTDPSTGQLTDNWQIALSYG